MFSTKDLRCSLFKQAANSFHLDLLEDDDFQQRIKLVIAKTGQLLEAAQEFVLIIAENDSESLKSDKEAFLAACLEALKLSIRDQESLLLLIAEDHLALQNALERLRKLQQVEDQTIESPEMRLKSETHLSLSEALNRLHERQRKDEVSPSQSPKPGL